MKQQLLKSQRITAEIKPFSKLVAGERDELFASAKIGISYSRNT
jgi:hypothetical protein